MPKKGEAFKWGNYMFIRNPHHPFSNKQGYIREHRLVFEQHFNCMLLPTTIIHHKNGNKLDNRVENLEAIISRNRHTQIHHPILDILCSHCGEQTSVIKGTNKHRWYKCSHGRMCDKCYKGIKRRFSK